MNKYIETRRKVKAVWRVLDKRLPKGYSIPVKCYASIYYLIKAVGEVMGIDYEEAKDIYNHYCDNKTKKTDYIDTKYYNPKDSVKHREECFYCDAFSGSPVWVACDNVQQHTKNEIAFLLLHEYCHVIFDTNNERRCDLFATRWVRKLIKEGLLPEN